MPFQPINVTGIEPIGRPSLRDLAENLMKGLQLGNAPKEMKQQNEARDLGNALQKIKLEQAQNPVASIDDILKRKKLEAETSKLNAETNNLTNPKADPLAEFKSQLLQLQVQKAQNDVDNAQTPDQQESAKLRLYEAQKKVDAQYAKPPAELTLKTKSANQAIIQAIDNVLPTIGKLSALNYGITTLDPATIRLAKQYQKESTETLIGALNLPSTDKSTKIVTDIVEKETGETATQYNKRLQELAIDLAERRQRADATLQTGKLYEGKDEARSILKKLGASPQQLNELFGEGSKGERRKLIELPNAPAGFKKYQIDKRIFTIPDKDVPRFLEKAKGL